MSWQVLITAAAIEKVGQSAVVTLQQAGCQIAHHPLEGSIGGEELVSLLNGMDAVLAGSDRYSPAVLNSPAAARLKIISRWGVGYDAIDVTAATAQGIV